MEKGIENHFQIRAIAKVLLVTLAEQNQDEGKARLKYNFFGAAASHTLSRDNIYEQILPTLSFALGAVLYFSSPVSRKVDECVSVRDKSGVAKTLNHGEQNVSTVPKD